MDEQNKHRSGRKFDDEDIIDVDMNTEEKLKQDGLSDNPDCEDVQEEETPQAPKRRTGLVAGVVAVSLTVVAGGYYYLENFKPKREMTPVVAAEPKNTSSISPSVSTVENATSTSVPVLNESSAVTPSAFSTDNKTSTPPSSVTTEINEASISDATPSSRADTGTNSMNATSHSLDTLNGGTKGLASEGAKSPDSLQEEAGVVLDQVAERQNPASQSNTDSSSTASESRTGSAQASTPNDAVTLDTATHESSSNVIESSSATSEQDSVRVVQEPEASTSNPVASEVSESITPVTPSGLTVENVVTNSSAEAPQLSQLQSQLQNQAQEIEQLKVQLHEAMQLNRQVANQVSAMPSLQQLSQPLMLAEVVRLYNSASYEVQIAGNVEKAKRILSLAQSSVLNMKDPSFNNLANGIAADINVLNNSKGINVDLLFQATSQLQLLLDQARFISPDSPPVAADRSTSASASQSIDQASSTADTVSSTAAESSWFDRAYDSTTQWADQAYDVLASDLAGLIKVEKLSNPELGLISVDQVQLIRNNLKHDVRIAQDAILKQEDGVWQTTLASILTNVDKYYDQHDEQTQTIRTLLNQLMDYSVKPELPELKFTKDAIEQISREIDTPTSVQY